MQHIDGIHSNLNCTPVLTCQEEVLQRSLRSNGGIELRTEASRAVVTAVDLSAWSTNIVLVCYRSPSINVFNLEKSRKEMVQLIGWIK